MIWEAHLGIEMLQASTEVGKLRRRDENHIELDYHHAGKFEILMVVVSMRQ